MFASLRNSCFALCAAVILVAGGEASAKTIEGVSFAETATVEGKELVLNGAGLRRVQRFGLPIKVYVAGLYVEKKVTTFEEAAALPGPKLLKMVFVRGVDKAQLEQAWRDGLSANCVKEECEEAREKLREFNKLMVDSKNKGTMDIQFHADKVVVDIDGRSKKSGTVEGAIFSRNLLAVFIGAKPPTEEFKKGLMNQP